MSTLLPIAQPNFKAFTLHLIVGWTRLGLRSPGVELGLDSGGTGLGIGGMGLLDSEKVDSVAFLKVIIIKIFQREAKKVFVCVPKL